MMDPDRVDDATMIRLPPDLLPAARVYLDAFPKGDVSIFPLTSLDRTGLPVWVAAFFPDDPSLHGLMPYGVGYGLTDEAAVLGALGEAAEMLWSTLGLRDKPRTRGSYLDLVASVGVGGIADPLTLGLPAGSPVDRDTVLEWVEGTRAKDGSTVLVPIDVSACGPLELTPGYVPFTNLITNGMGAGPDLEWAIGHGLCEVLQRDGNGLLFRAMDTGVLMNFPGELPATTQAMLDRFGGAGIRLLPKYATDQFGIPNIYCVGHDTDGRLPSAPIMLTACGEGCHPDRIQALEKAVCEFASSRVRKAFAHGPASLVQTVAPPGYVDRFMAQAGGAGKSTDSRAFTSMRDWTGRQAAELQSWLADTVLSVRSHKNFFSLPEAVAPDSRARGKIARDRVEAAGLDIIYVDMSPADRSITVVKVIVPGLEVETMSYYRLGERNTRKLMERDSPLIRFGAPTETLLPVRLTPQARAKFDGQPLFDTVLADRIVGPLYPLYREPEAHHVAWAEEQSS